jgi:hypothetical protein
MSLPEKPIACANRLTMLLQAVQNATGESFYPVKIKEIAFDISRQFFPSSPITKITGEDFAGKFDGMLRRIPTTKDDWGIIYNTGMPDGRINFTLAHELGHYLLHRLGLEQGIIQCDRNAMRYWDSEEHERESEANEFASYLLMPRNIFENLIKGKETSLHLLQHVADHFDVSLTAAILKWLQFTNKRAMLVVGKEGFIDWVWSSDPLRDSWVYLQPRKQLIELPAQSLAVKKDAFFDNETGVVHKAGIWPFKEDVKEMTVIRDTYDLTITLLLFPDEAPNRFAQLEEEPELMDTFQKFNYTPSEKKFR